MAQTAQTYVTPATEVVYPQSIFPGGRPATMPTGVLGASGVPRTTFSTGAPAAIPPGSPMTTVSPGVPGYPTGTYVEPVSRKRMSAWEWIFIIIVIAIIIGFIIWAIWHYGVRETGLPSGSKCTSNTECAAGTYCSATEVCTTGTGKTRGEKCSVNRDCVLGLTCDQRTDVCRDPFTPIPPPDNPVPVNPNPVGTGFVR